jgi:hypothetical protein
MDDELFDNGIDGEPCAENESQAGADSYCAEDDYKESVDIVNADGLEIQGWPTYGNYTIVTDTFHIYWWYGSNTLEFFDRRLPHKEFANCHTFVLTLKNQDLYFFGDKTTQREDGKWEIDWYTGEQVDQKIQRYLNLRAFT